VFEIRLTDSGLAFYTEYSVIVDTTFYVQYGEECFPYEGWNDSVNHILPMWAEALLANRRGKEASYRLYFMDGPYRIDVRQTDGRLLLQGIEDGSKQRIVFSCTCTQAEVLREVLKAFQRLEKIIYLHDAIRDEDAKSVLNTIRHYTKQIRRALEEA